jgi:hypothetical protein
VAPTLPGCRACDALRARDQEVLGLVQGALAEVAPRLDALETATRAFLDAQPRCAGVSSRSGALRFGTGCARRAARTVAAPWTRVCVACADVARAAGYALERPHDPAEALERALARQIAREAPATDPSRGPERPTAVRA